MASKRKKPRMKKYLVEVYVCTYKTVTVRARSERSAGAIGRSRVAGMTGISRKETEIMDVAPFDD